VAAVVRISDRLTRNTDGSEQQQHQEEQQQSRRRVKVLLADDHTMFREGLASMLTSSYGDEVEVVGKTDTGEHALALAQEKNPEVVIMQIDEALHKAKSTLERLRNSLSPSSPKVIILTLFEEPRMVRKIMELGANAYLHKSASVEELFTALHTTALDTQGEHVVIAMPQRALELSEEDGVRRDGVRSILSERELEILLQAARGMSNRKIASHLSISEATVKRHLANIYPKMSVGSRAEAVRVGLEKEWFTIHEITATIENA